MEYLILSLRHHTLLSCIAENFLNIKFRITFNKDSSAVELNNYLCKIVNVDIVYDLDTWSRNPTNNLKFKNCLFAAINIVRNSDKEKYVYSG